MLESLTFVLRYFQKKEFDIKPKTEEELMVFIDTLAGALGGMGEIIEKRDPQMYSTLITALEQLALR